MVSTKGDNKSGVPSPSGLLLAIQSGSLAIPLSVWCSTTGLVPTSSYQLARSPHCTASIGMWVMLLELVWGEDIRVDVELEYHGLFPFFSIFLSMFPYCFHDFFFYLSLNSPSPFLCFPLFFLCFSTSS